MKSSFRFALIFVLLASFSAFAVVDLQVNGSKETVVSSKGQKVRLAGNLDSPNSVLHISFYLDANNNKKIDSKDPLVHFLSIKDGVGPIVEPGISGGDIPGDENFVPFRFQTTIDAKALYPPNSQTWIIRAEENGSSEEVILGWEISESQANLRINFNSPHKTGPQLIYALDEAASQRQKIAPVYGTRPAALHLAPGRWIIFAESLSNPYLQSDFCDVEVTGKPQTVTLPSVPELSMEVPDCAPVMSINKELFAEEGSGAGRLILSQIGAAESNRSNILPLSQAETSFVTGTVLIHHELPAEGVTIVAVNEQEKSPAGTVFARTDHHGRFTFATAIPGEWKIGVYSRLYDCDPAVQYLYVSEGEDYRGLRFDLHLKEQAGHQGGLRLETNYAAGGTDQTLFQVRLPQRCRAKMEILDINGRNIRTLLNGELPDSEAVIPWDGRDDSGIDISSGVYLCRIETETESVTKTFALLK